MSAVAICECESIGAPLQVRYCDEHHSYFYGDRRLNSVTSIIKFMCPTDYSAVDPVVLENARTRGVLVDRYFCEYLRSGHLHIDADEREDVKDRLKLLIPWWDRQGFEIHEVQEIVFSKEDGVAGCLDLRIGIKSGSAVYDLKVVSSLQKAYGLQLGAYLTYGNADEAGIVHVTKDKCRLVKYDAEKCKRHWKTLIDAFNLIQEYK